MPKTATTRPLDHLDLYEICVQSPEYDARMLRAIHGGSPRILGEDFCGTAAICRAWLALDRGHRAVAADLDAPTLAKAQTKDPGLADPKQAGRITYLLADVRDVRDRADIVAAQNFAICELHTRESLVRYLLNVRSRLTRGGIFACDIYAGADSYFTGRIDQTFKGPGGEKIKYTWEHRTADPLRARVQNAIHFEVRGGSVGRTPLILNDAFVYNWRLWSPAELADALREAGFAEVEFYARFADAVDDNQQLHMLPITDSNELSDSFNVFVVGRR